MPLIFLKDFPRYSFSFGEVKKNKGSPKSLYIALLKLGECEIPNTETGLLMVKFKSLPSRSFIFLSENKKPRGKF